MDPHTDLHFTRKDYTIRQPPLTHTNADQQHEHEAGQTEADLGANVGAHSRVHRGCCHFRRSILRFRRPSQIPLRLSRFLPMRPNNNGNKTAELDGGFGKIISRDKYNFA